MKGGGSTIRFRNIKDVYLDDIVKEMDRLNDNGYDAEEMTLTRKVHRFERITLPGGIKCMHIKSSLFVSRVGGIVAVAAHTTNGDETLPTIITDELFDRLDRNGKKFIFTHEAGHIINGHIGDAGDAMVATATDLDGVIQRSRSIENEYVADAFAAKINGKFNTIRAMKDFAKLMKHNPWLEFDPGELKRRIRHVAKLKRGA